MPGTQKLGRKARERQKHVEDILDAAEAVFADKGYERARMNDIARRAEFSVGYLYQTWESKAALFVALIESKFRDFKRELEEKIAAAAEPVEQIHVLIDAHADFIDRNKAFTKLYLVEGASPELRALDRIGGQLARAHTAYLRMVEKIFERGSRSGVFIDVPPTDLALALEGIILAFAKDHLKRRQDLPFTRRTTAMKRIFFESVLKHPAKPRKEPAR